MKAELIDKFPGLAALEVIYEDHARDCVRCALHETRKSVVFGTGNSEQPDVAFVGDMPRIPEEDAGYPFVGKGGKLLTQMIDAMGYERQEVYLLTALSCRPPDRSPKQEELKACWPITASQIKAVQPKTIVCLGVTAAQQVLQIKGTLDTFRNRWYRWEDIPTRVTYHPNQLNANPKLKPGSWVDLQAVMARLGKSPVEANHAQTTESSQNGTRENGSETRNLPL